MSLYYDESELYRNDIENTDPYDIEAGSVCPDCGEQMTWCSGCDGGGMWSQTCCQEFGTCACS